MLSNHALPSLPSQNPNMVSPFDPFSLVALPDPSSASPNMGPAFSRANKDGVGGDPTELISVFDACLRVGRLERAMLVLNRVDTIPSFTEEERIVLHNQFLRAAIQKLRTSPNAKQEANSLHQWYEMNIRRSRAQGLPHTPETIACMLKISIVSESGTRLRRLVKRYMGMAPGEAGLQVLYMADILSDSDLATITEICPTYNFESEPQIEDGELEAQVEEANARAQTEEGLAQATPELASTDQRGEGLKTLRQGLAFLRDIQDVDVSALPEADQREIQLQLERDSIGSALSRWRLENQKRQQQGVQTAITGSNSQGLPGHVASWLQATEDKLKEEFKLIVASEQKAKKGKADLERCAYGSLIMQSEPARLAAVTILTVLNASAHIGMDKGTPVSRLFNLIGGAVQEDVFLQSKERRRKEFKKRNLSYNKAKAEGRTEEEIKEEQELAAQSRLIEEPHEAKERLAGRVDQLWSLQTRAKVGSVLLKTLIETAKMKVTKRDPQTGAAVHQYQPAFIHGTEVRRGKNQGVINLNAALVENLKREPMPDFMAKHLPMITPPRPWQSLKEGGFLESKAQLVRFDSGDVEQGLYAKAAVNAGDFKTVFKGLDVLGKTAWRINTKVLNVLVEAWNRGLDIANIPPLNVDTPTPAEPDQVTDPEGYRQWLRVVKRIENERAGKHSERCLMNLQLEVARAFRNQTIYFPHNVDYRGRAYPIPTYLNHMGADHMRGILTFAKGKPLGARGLRWLKIHLANVHGLDKASFNDREAFATENLANIRDSATNPLDGERWWLKAEDPFQCLATCFELKAAFDLEDPTQYVSHMPVQQDGTCNGLQHYAALGGDTWGAKQVNLEPGDKPADVYSAVANLVKEAIVKDVADDNPVAKILDGKITRKVVKQTVMTNVYGVTYSGAKKQVCKQIDALYPSLGPDNGMTNMDLSAYIARKIFAALASMFRGAHDIQYWLGEAGGRVCRALTKTQLDQMAENYNDEPEVVGKGGATVKKAKDPSGKKGIDELTNSFRSTVVWTTPLRMPVVQPYRKPSVREVRTCMQTVAFAVREQTDPVNRRKQLQGFPPNFIHSLDASHMLLSALQCNELGLDFAAVHDSFWTHAADVDAMNGVIREAFIQIHEEDIIGRLAAEFKTRHHGSLYLAHIDPETPVAKKIKALRTRSKLSPKQELLLEHKRNTLKLSGNPWDLEAAKQIVTPASVYEDMAAAEADVSIKEDAAGMQLGAIPDATEEAAQDALLEEDAEDAAADAKAPVKKAAKVTRSAVPVWLPLTVPEVPKKGDFDVRRLRDSKYFFS
ncbi:uncharacterized protein F5Z01DRAFT_625401 [Emericellopsis atlantica]|uniref:DNA-directed RNA polymerase n=1 Tax=Emericellopsis atlantica TaxID=2614577 RepID=A0A9P7ZJI9_9HYPO|nr:uncharacterized protein F5Z01DRAFT_625401 [Emericellopsis atlantica]KAG9252648.1 hypothetical protein F5Z01DRAFT_625401 [Emericellopsis atlantica]